MTGTTISGIHYVSVTLSSAATQNPATVATGATIAADGSPLIGQSPTSWTITNYGIISGTGNVGTGISMAGSGTIFNRSSGSIYGTNHGVALAGGGTLSNEGSISAGTTGVNAGAVYLVAGGYVTNLSGGVISAASSGILGLGAGAVTVANQGTITAAADGVYINTGGSVTNQSGGVINAGGNGIELLVASPAYTGYVANLSGGTILAGTFGIYVSGGTAVNQGFISATSDGMLLIGGSSGTNETGGTIIASGVGVSLDGGSFTNQLGATISGSGAAAILATGLATVVNAGLIDPVNDGVSMQAGGTVTNVSGGTIVGIDAGVRISGAPGTVINAGSIYAIGTNSSGVELISGGSVTNQAGGTIDGTLYGVDSSNAATVTNSGTIGVTALIGVGLAFGQVTNAASATIAGATSGVRIFGGGTVVNAGTISGGGDAVHLYAGSTARLVVDPGAVFSGTVDGGNIAGATAVSTLELASAATPGTLSGLGTQFIDFAQITVDAGATWVLDTTDTIGSGVTLTNAGTLTGAVTLAAGAELSNLSTGTISVSSGSAVYALPGGTATVINAGRIADTDTAGSGIYLAAGGSVTNQSGGTISGYDGIFAGPGVTTVVNYGDIAATGGVGVGVGILAGGSVTNLSGGMISGSIGVLGGYPGTTVVNAGDIAGGSASLNAGIELAAGGSVTNLSSGTISGYGGIYGGASVPLTVVNYGTVAATKYGVILSGGGSVTNQSGGTISGYGAIYSDYVAAAVVNAGHIIGSATAFLGAGVVLLAGGGVTNQSTGTISGASAIYAEGALTVVNAGSIAGYGGIILTAGGYITNQTSGTINAGVGVYGKRTAVTVVNDGAILGGTATSFTGGIALVAGGSVTNGSDGTIVGYDGVYGGNSAGLTVVNAGTITGTAAAVQFKAGYADRVVFDPGAIFVGTVDGGNTIGATAVSTLELAAGKSTGTLSGIGTQFINFAQTTIDAGAYWTLTGANTFAAGTTLTNAGTLSLLNTTLSDAGLVVNNGTIEIDPSTFTLNDLTGTGSVLIDGGSTLDVLGTVTAGETIVFGSGSNLLGVNPTAFAGQIDGFTAGDTIELTGVTDGFSPVIVNGNTLEIQRQNNPPVDLTLDPAVSYAGAVFNVSSTGAVTEAPCFLRDTRIRTETGEVMVHDLAIGDRVLTLSGAARQITWIGTGRVLVNPGRRCDATPVIVRKSALADNIPYHDLRITKGHALFVDGVLIPVEFLINHRSIQWDDHRKEVEFYHIELETHDVLIANGAPSESYRDDGNRWLFQNANSGWGQPPKPPCAPVLTGGPIVDATWRRLLDRAAPRPNLTLTDDPDLHLLVDGVRIDAAAQYGAVHEFRLAHRPATVRIVSRAAAPGELGLVRDPRRLGVAIARIMVGKGMASRVMEVAHPDLTDGFHGFEPALGHRWTDGDAALPAALFEGLDGAMTVVLNLSGSARYPTFVQATAQVAA